MFFYRNYYKPAVASSFHSCWSGLPVLCELPNSHWLNCCAVMEWSLTFWAHYGKGQSEKRKQLLLGLRIQRGKGEQMLRSHPSGFLTGCIEGEHSSKRQLGTSKAFHASKCFWFRVTFQDHRVLCVLNKHQVGRIILGGDFARSCRPILH